MTKRGRVIKAAEMTEPHLARFHPDKGLDSRHGAVREAEERIAEKESTRAELQKLREEAVQRGYAEGHAKGMEEGRLHEEALYRDRLNEELRTTREGVQSALQSLVERMEAEQHEWRTRWDQAAVDVVCSVASRVTRKAIKLDTSVAGRTLHEILALVARSPRITASVHPDDLEFIESQRAALERLRVGSPPLEFLADASLERGGCRVHTESCSIDADVAIQIDKLLTEFAGQSPKGVDRNLTAIG